MGKWIAGVPSWAARSVWPEISPWVQAALDHGSYETLDGVLAKIENQTRQLWLVMDGVRPVAQYITELQVIESTLALHLFAIGGEGVDDWVALVDTCMTEFAKAKGCKVMTSTGRRGWSRKLDPLGWKDSLIVRVKEV